MNNKTFWKLIDKLEEEYDVDSLRKHLEDCAADQSDEYGRFLETYKKKVAILRYACAEESVYNSRLRHVMTDSTNFTYLLRSAVLSGHEVWSELVDDPTYLVDEGFSAVRWAIIQGLFGEQQNEAAQCTCESCCCHKGENQPHAPATENQTTSPRTRWQDIWWQSSCTPADDACTKSNECSCKACQSTCGSCDCQDEVKSTRARWQDNVAEHSPSQSGKDAPAKEDVQKLLGGLLGVMAACVDNGKVFMLTNVRDTEHLGRWSDLIGIDFLEI